MRTAGKLARRYALSRSTLLYYHRIGLLVPSGRSAANYRVYSDADRERLERILAYRDAGVPIEAIRTLLAADPAASAALLEHQLFALNAEIARLRAQQRVIARLLGGAQALRGSRTLDKAAWVGLLAATGLSEAEMDLWHVEFERRAPEAHQDFLEALGIPLAEIVAIRQRSAAAITPPA